MKFTSGNEKASLEILNPNLMGNGWEELVKNRNEVMERVLAERMVSMKHAKAPRLLSGVGMKYSTILPYLNSGNSVLDLCAGSGLGSVILAQSDFQVTAADYFTEVLEHRANISILNIDLRNEELPFKNDFDAVTFVDAIEHFNEKLQHRILEQIFKVLKPGGYLMIDTPMSKSTGPKSQHHVRELTWEAFGGMVSKYFKIIKRYQNRFHGETFPVLTQHYSNNLMPVMDNIDQIIIGKK